MKLKIFLVFVAIMCCVASVAAVDTSGVTWTKLDGTVITSAYYGDTVRANFFVLDSPVYNYTLIRLWSLNPQTEAWELMPYPTFDIQANGSTSSNTTVGGSFYHMIYATEDRWLGWTNFTVPVSNISMYKAEVQVANGVYVYTLNNATISVSKNPFQMGSIGDIAKSIGGSGLAYIIGALIIVVLALLPYLIMRTFNVYIELCMIAFGVGISYVIGLFDLWVVLALVLGSVALYLTVNRTSGGNN